MNKKIKELREKSFPGWGGQADCAKKFGVSPQYWRDWESGKRAGLEVKKIHEIRHTLGTLASRNFNPRMVQAAMHHLDEKSARSYFHPDEEMAAEVRQKIITELSQKRGKAVENQDQPNIIIYTKNGEYACPCCDATLYITKRKAAKH